MEVHSPFSRAPKGRFFRRYSRKNPSLRDAIKRGMIWFDYLPSSVVALFVPRAGATTGRGFANRHHLLNRELQVRCHL
jgi:hypothetical protein